MKVNDILSAVAQDYVRGNKYKVILTPPKALAKYDNDIMQVINKNCNSVNFPGTDILTFDWASKSAPIVLPYQRSYNPIVMNFYMDGNGYVRQFFEDWIDVIWNPETYNMNYLSEYSTEMKLQLLDQQNTAVRTWHMTSIWPMKIDDLPMAYSDGEVAKMTVTMTYNIYEMNGK